MDVSRLKAFGPGPGSANDLQTIAPRTAARVEQGKIRHFQPHLERLATSAEAMGSSAPWLNGEAASISEWVMGVSSQPREVLRMRLLGDQLWALLEPLPETPTPYTLLPYAHPLGAPSRNPLAPHKGLTGDWGVGVLRQMKMAGAEDALLFWPDGTLVETAIASLTLEVDGELWLPPQKGRVASLAERLDLPEWARERAIRTQPFRESDLNCGTLWCFNAVRGFWPGTPLCPKM